MNYKKTDGKERLAQKFLDEGMTLVERDPGRLKHMLSTDIRDTIPPEIYALIAAVASEVEKNVEAE